MRAISVSASSSEAAQGSSRIAHAGRAHQPLDVGMRHRVEDDEIGPEIEDGFGRGADGGNVARAIGQDRGAGIAREIADPDQLPRRGEAQGELIEAEVDGHDPSRGFRTSRTRHRQQQSQNSGSEPDRHVDNDPGEVTPPTNKSVLRECLPRSLTARILRAHRRTCTRRS